MAKAYDATAMNDRIPTKGGSQVRHEETHIGVNSDPNCYMPSLRNSSYVASSCAVNQSMEKRPPPASSLDYGRLVFPGCSLCGTRSLSAFPFDDFLCTDTAPTRGSLGVRVLLRVRVWYNARIIRANTTLCMRFFINIPQKQLLAKSQFQAL